MVPTNNSEFDIFSLFERTPDLVCIVSKDGYWKKVNRSVIDILGYSEEELYSRPVHSFIHPEDRELTGRKRDALLEGKALLNFQNRYLTSQGHVVWLHWTSVYLPEKEIVFAIAKDVTETKAAEKEIEEKYRKYKSLATHFKASMEKDRKYLALELHEELAQLATAVKMDLEWVSNNSPCLEPVVKSRMDHSLAVSGLLVDAIRRISYSLSPDMLDELGLNETLIWLCDEFALLNGIPCWYECNCDPDHLPREVQLDLYRICQEALTNAMYVADASCVTIKLEHVEGHLCLTIADDGKINESLPQKSSPGLLGIKERAASINGHLVINRENGKGNEICVSIRGYAEVMKTNAARQEF